MDSFDKNIIRILQQDGRISNSDLATRINLSPSACLRRVKALEEVGIIDSISLNLDPVKVGFSGSAFVNVTLEGQSHDILEAFETAVGKEQQIIECYLLAGQADFMLRVVFRDMEDLERLHTRVITQLPGVLRVQTILSLRAVKKNSVLPV